MTPRGVFVMRSPRTGESVSQISMIR
jgi:hypothetical protein